MKDGASVLDIVLLFHNAKIEEFMMYFQHKHNKVELPSLMAYCIQMQVDTSLTETKRVADNWVFLLYNVGSNCLVSYILEMFTSSGVALARMDNGAVNFYSKVHILLETLRSE